MFEDLSRLMHKIQEASFDRPAPELPPPRILHVVSSVDRGGIELWLLHLLHIDRRRFPMDALVLNDRHGPLESELRSRGFYCANDWCTPLLSPPRDHRESERCPQA